MFRLVILFLGLLISFESSAQKNFKKVYISKFVDHPALNKTVKGIIDGLAFDGYKNGENLDLQIESAQANSALAAQIASKFVNLDADVAVGVATISAQSFLKYAKQDRVKLIFSSVTDPLQAGLVKSLEKPGYNTTGVSNFVDLDPQISLFLLIQPGLRKLGFIYNPSELNSLSLLKKLEEICPKYSIEIISQAVSRTSDISQATTRLASEVDAIFISNDSTALSALKTIINIANKASRPVYVSDTDAVELGAIAALGPNQYKIGLQTAKLIVRVLNGENPGEISVEFPASTELFLNQKAARKLNIEIPSEVLARAESIISE